MCLCPEIVMSRKNGNAGTDWRELASVSTGNVSELPSFVDRSGDPGTKTTVIYPSLRRWIIILMQAFEFS